MGQVRNNRYVENPRREPIPDNSQPCLPPRSVVEKATENVTSSIGHDKFCEELEGQRSIVISGIPECKSTSVRERKSYDYYHVCNIIDFLGIECNAVTLYRLGKPSQGKNRLIKIMFSRVFQRIALRRAARLRFYSLKGIFLRESLTKKQRERRCEQRKGLTKNELRTSSVTNAYTSENVEAHPQIMNDKTWLKPSHNLSSLLCSSNEAYNNLRCDRLKKLGGGVVLMVHSRLSVSLVFRESVKDGYEILCADIFHEERVFEHLTFMRDDDKLPEFSSTLTQSMHDLPWFQADWLYKQIMKWPKSSSTNPDFIPLFFIQKVAWFICEPLAYIFNQSLMRGEVPRRWKHSHVMTRFVSSPQERICSNIGARPMCSEGVLRKEYSAEDLFHQQMLFKRVVDVKTALSELTMDEHRFLQANSNIPSVIPHYYEISHLVR
ncbi:hypothetical protein OSTOST_03015 [Ostertagia ostertagi]